MKPNQNSKGKLQLKKHAISNLSKAELENVKGGLNEQGGDVTTSWNQCTGVLCCHEPTLKTITISVVVTLTIIL